MIANLKTWLCSILLLFILSGCWLEDKEEKYKGTVKGVSICIEKNEKQSNLVSETLIKQQCIRQHERVTYFSDQKSLGSAQFKLDSMYVNASVLYNLFEDKIITAVKLSGVYYDAMGERHESSGEWSESLWIEPKQTVETSVSIFPPDSVEPEAPNRTNGSPNCL